jgi:hypothetical protein
MGNYWINFNKSYFSFKNLCDLPPGRRPYGPEAAFWFAELFPNIKRSERPVLPADPSSFQRLSNKGHINTRTCRLPAAPEEVACVPEPPVCIADNKAPWHQIPCTHPLCSIPFDGLTPDIRIFSNSFSLLQSFVTFIDSQSPIYLS